MRDAILIEGLRMPTMVGVPDEERAGWQEVLVDLVVEMEVGFGGIADEIGATLDYDALCRRVLEVGRSRPRQLIETLGNEIAEMVLAEGGVARVEVVIRKRILANTNAVGVRVVRP